MRRHLQAEVLAVDSFQDLGVEIGCYSLHTIQERRKVLLGSEAREFGVCQRERDAGVEFEQGGEAKHVSPAALRLADTLSELGFGEHHVEPMRLGSFFRAKPGEHRPQSALDSHGCPEIRLPETRLHDSIAETARSGPVEAERVDQGQQRHFLPVLSQPSRYLIAEGACGGVSDEKIRPVGVTLSHGGDVQRYPLLETQGRLPLTQDVRVADAEDVARRAQRLDELVVRAKRATRGCDEKERRQRWIAPFPQLHQDVAISVGVGRHPAPQAINEGRQLLQRRISIQRLVRQLFCVEAEGCAQSVHGRK